MTLLRYILKYSSGDVGGKRAMNLQANSAARNAAAITESRSTPQFVLSVSPATPSTTPAEEPLVRPGSPLHYADCEDTRMCRRCSSADVRDTAHKSALSAFQRLRPAKSFHSLPFFRDHSGSLRLLRGRKSRLAPSAAASHSAINTVGAASPTSCGAAGDYLLPTHAPTCPSSPGSYLFRTMSLRYDKKRFAGLRAKFQSKSSSLTGNSRSLETLVVDGIDAKKPRGITLKRLPRGRAINTSESETTTHSNSDINKNIGEREHNPCIPADQSVGLSRVTSWAASFEKLLQDPAGLHTFAEFLRKEFSHENIYFWTACERYKMIRDENERRDIVRRIFDRHLASGAPDPVNIDAQARTVAQQGLSEPDEFIFAPAQKHIFLLMKFDSYSRFLKSDLYNSCLSRELKGLTLPFPGDDTLDDDLRICFDEHFSKYLKKSKSDADDRRRKSLLPWHRSKDRSKSKDRGETDYRSSKKYGGNTPSESSSSMRSDITDSFTSLNSSDFIPGLRTVSKESLSSCDDGFANGENKHLCRVILPDNSNSLVAIKSHLTVKCVIKQLLDRRRVNFSAFNVYQKGDKLIDLNKSSSVMNGLEVRVEQMVLFSLHLPSRKTVYVKAKPHKLGSEVLKPILSKYGHKLDTMSVNKYSDSELVHLKEAVMELDGEKCVVTHKDETKNERSNSRDNKLIDLTNRIFDDVLEGKIKSRFDHLGVLDFDARSINTDTSSDSSSDMLGNFSRRESLPMERDDLRLSGSSRGKNNSLRRQNADPTSTTLQENELYEGLNRAQNSRLDDQRGTEINFELPDFLKCEQTQGVAKLITRGDFMSEEHPEVWGCMDDSADKTVLATEPDDCDKTLCDVDHSVASPRHVTITAPAQFLTPPPPLPPKPKLGALSRGPPPRPPSRTAPPHPILMDVPSRVPARQSADKFSVSFV